LNALRGAEPPLFHGATFVRGAIGEKQVPHRRFAAFGMTKVGWPVRNDMTGLPVQSDKTMDYYPNSLLEAATIE
jgi:hypothetical protein